MQKPNKLIPYPDHPKVVEPVNGTEWGFVIVGGLLTYGIGWILGGIYLTIKDRKYSEFQSLMRAYNAEVQNFLQHHQIDRICSVYHEGSHPQLPLNTRFLMGTRQKELIFITLSGETLLTVPIEQVNFQEYTQMAISSFGGDTYENYETGFGTISGYSAVDYSPDSIIMSIPVKENNLVESIFGVDQPREVIHWLNGLKFSD